MPDDQRASIDAHRTHRIGRWLFTVLHDRQSVGYHTGLNRSLNAHRWQISASIPLINHGFLSVPPDTLERCIYILTYN